MFGGSMFSAMDPLAMVALIHILGEDYVVWDKSASIQYKRPANQHVHAKFTFEEIAFFHWHTFGNKLKNVANADFWIHRMAIPWTSADGKGHSPCQLLQVDGPRATPLGVRTRTRQGNPW